MPVYIGYYNIFDIYFMMTNDGAMTIRYMRMQNKIFAQKYF